MTQTLIETVLLEQLVRALEINRVMSVDSDGNYTKEVTPKIITEAITAGHAAIDGARQKPKIPTDILPKMISDTLKGTL